MWVDHDATGVGIPLERLPWAGVLKSAPAHYGTGDFHNYVRMSLPPEGLRNMDAAELRPERIGPYDIVETLAHGPRSRTYKGFDPSAQRTVALKTISKELLDSTSRERLQTQVRAAARLEIESLCRWSGRCGFW